MHSEVAGSIPREGDIIRSKQQSSVSVYYVKVFTGFSGHGNSIHKKKRTCQIVDFAIPADQRVKLKGSERKDKYLELAREQKKLWNTEVTVIPTVIGALSTVRKVLIKGLEDMELR